MTHPTANTYLRLAEMILRRYQAHTQKSLADVYQVDPHFLNIALPDVSYLTAERADILKVLDDAELSERLVELFVSASMAFTYQNNQFVRLDRTETGVLVGIYRAYLADLRELVRGSTSAEALDAGMRELVRSHFEDLSANIARFFDAEVAGQPEENVILKQAVCAEYSPALQLRILGVQPARLREPILDLGCGSSGKLVQALCAQGLDAYGVDRIVEPLDNLIERDWLEMDLQPGRWGTILSHMAFSNHFVFQHRYKHGSPREYAQKYMHILNALQPGGSFYYAPGLPFIEQFLPARFFKLKKRDLAALRLSPAASPEIIDQDTWYAARVTRL